MNETVSLNKFIEEFELEKIYETKDIDNVVITTANINRPGLQLAGFYDYFDPHRVQVMGKVEFTFLEQFATDDREARLERFFSNDFPCLVITRSLQIFPEMMDLAEKYNKNLLRIDQGASEFLSSVVAFLSSELAPRRTRHGVLVDVYGEGILIMGESGVGKSEAAIELVKRGHILIADDAVEIRRISDNHLVGSSPEIIRHFVEVRGIGIIDMKEIFGIGSVKDSGDIDMIIHLEPWSDQKSYDRLGMVDEYTNIMGINVPSLTIPVKLGRNLAVIIEIAAMNNRQKKMGYNAAVELNNRLMHQMEDKLGL